LQAKQNNLLDHKLFEVLRTFSESEFSEFDKFIRSPFHNEGRNYSGILKSLKKYYPGFNGKNLTRENLFKAAYPGEEFNGNKLNIAFSRLYKSALDFLAIYSLKSNEFEMNRLTLSELAKRKLFEKFDKLLPETFDLIKPNSDFSERYFEEKSLLYRMGADKIFSTDEIFSRKNEISKRTEYTLYSVINKMILCRYDLSLFKNDFGSDFDAGITEAFFETVDIEKILDSLKESGSEYYTVLAFKYYGILLRTTSEDIIYSKYKELFYADFEKFTYSEKYVYYNNMSGYCIRKSNEGDRTFDNELINIYKKMVQFKLFGYSEEDYFDLSHFRNILLSSFDVNDLDFAESLINDYSEYLNPQFRENMVNYSKAKLYFARKEPDKSLDFASKVKQDFFLFKTDIKILLIQLYFEMEYYEELFSLIDSFKHFISNSSDIYEARKTRYMNFLKYISSITKLKIHFDDEKNSRLKTELTSAKDVALSGWLLSKLS